MKIRRGFVSNSSTSSFICIGVQVPYDEKYWVEDALFLGTKEGFILGKNLESKPSNSTFTQSMSIIELQTYVNEVAEKLNVHPNEIKLFFGVREC